MASFELTEVRLENLRGYYNARLSLTADRILIVGPNNSGKTSVLRLLNWALNELDVDALERNEPPPSDQLEFLLPARDARHRARRLALEVHVTDGRSWSKFGCNDNGKTTLRLNVRMTPQRTVYAALGSATRGEKPLSDPNAVELLRRLRDEIHFIHIPSFRDVRSERFSSTLSEAVHRRVEARAFHSGQGGAPAEYRRVSEAFGSLQDVMLELSRPLWDDVKPLLPPGMARDASIELSCDSEDLLRFLESQLRLRITTGDHDSKSVPLRELGSGLQSLLDLAIQESEVPEEKPVVIAAEEPEAFLHPSAQRTISMRLLDHEAIDKAIVTTHSPIVIEEAAFGDVVLCRDHKFYEPAGVAASEREDINTALLSGFGAEMMFARSVILVEGEGDRQFFERLRRRLSAHDPEGEVDLCFVVPVGGKAGFAPWIRMLQAYGNASDRPIRWLVVADGDASTDVLRAFRDAGLSMKQEVLEALGDVTAAKNEGDISAWRFAVDDVNRTAREEGVQLHLLSLDLEEAALGAAGDESVERIKGLIDLSHVADRKGLLNALGAKGFGNGEGRKDPWMRGLVGEELEPKEISADVTSVLRLWFGGAMEEKKVTRILTEWMS